MTGERELHFALPILCLCTLLSPLSLHTDGTGTSDVGLGEEENTRKKEQRFGATPTPTCTRNQS